MVGRGQRQAIRSITRWSRVEMLITTIIPARLVEEYTRSTAQSGDASHGSKCLEKTMSSMAHIKRMLSALSAPAQAWVSASSRAIRAPSKIIIIEMKATTSTASSKSLGSPSFTMPPLHQTNCTDLITAWEGESPSRWTPERSLTLY